MSGYDVIVAGGGAAGMMAAGAAAEAGARVLLVEKNSRLGRKLRITGKGRCNVTNHCTVQEVIANTPSNGRFLYGALSRFGPADMELSGELGRAAESGAGKPGVSGVR